MLQKSFKSTITINKECWQCNNPKHHHKTEGIANRCIKKQGNARTVVAMYARNQDIVLRILKGAPTTELGEQYGLSTQRIGHILKSHIHRCRSFTYDINNVGVPLSYKNPRSMSDIRNESPFWLKRIENMYKVNLTLSTVPRA